MSHSVKIDDCVKCKHHVKYRDGFVMCGFFKRPEQRMTQTINYVTYLINCPKREKGKMSAQAL